MEIDTGKMNRLAEFIKTNPDLLQQMGSASDLQAGLTILADASRKHGIDINLADLTALVKQADTPKQGVLTVEQLDLINAGSNFEDVLKSIGDSIAGAFKVGGIDAYVGLTDTAIHLRNIAVLGESKS